LITIKNHRKYDKERINDLAEEYKKTSTDIVFEELIIEIIGIVHAQLCKRYRGVEHLWDDLLQETLLRVWKNREKIKTTETEEPQQYYYGRVRHHLFELINAWNSESNGNGIRVILFSDLVSADKRKLGLEITEGDRVFFGE